VVVFLYNASYTLLRHTYYEDLLPLSHWALSAIIFFFCGPLLFLAYCSKKNTKAEKRSDSTNWLKTKSSKQKLKQNAIQTKRNIVNRGNNSRIKDARFPRLFHSIMPKIQLFTNACGTGMIIRCSSALISFLAHAECVFRITQPNNVSFIMFARALFSKNSVQRL